MADGRPGVFLEHPGGEIASDPSHVAQIGPERSVRVAVVGISASEICGVRDHAVLLAEALEHEKVSCSLHWLWRSEASMWAGAAEIRSWTRGLAGTLKQDRPDAILLHYSVFSYSYRGVPLYIRPTLSAIHGSGIPLITVLHEFAYPWGRRGMQGAAWSLTQRARLIDVMRASAAVLVTTSRRAQWLATRRWLPKRRVLVAPVFSNLPAATVRARADRPGHVIGLFGYAHERDTALVVLGAVRLLEERGLPIRLMLLGAPGRSSAVAEMWLASARVCAVTHVLAFSGALPAQDLSDALAECDVLLFVDPSGPTSRKTTLAASLASGRAVVALDGPQRWAELVESEAARIVEPSSSALADALAALLADETLSEALGKRGRAFAAQKMGTARSAQTVAGLIGEALSARRS